ncbi:MAG TPA: electron transfer flavoprotein subunit alpha/FixB family protein [Candidatus Saccharimonadales bacterium]|nr:electron transfer flavoprotein subunit alpha/FixB family protein [Candidatus Saccharimonadales bacterium]
MSLGKIWVFAEVASGKPAPVALELLAKARSLSATVEAVAFAPDAADAATELGAHGATTLFAGTDPLWGEVLLGGPAADALATLIEEHKPDLVLFAMTYNSRDVAGRLAAKLGVPVIANGLELSDGDGITVHSSVFGATLDVATRFEGGAPALAIIRPKSFTAEASGGAAAGVIQVTSPIDEKHRSARVTDRVADVAAGPKLEEAPIVISGGRGLGDPKNFELLDQLAAVLGNAAVGASRAVVDAGWVPYAMQVGQTGKTVKPAVYLAFGISGAMQHTVGMKGAKAIVAVNRDENAPIFKLADLGIVGDALKVLPALVEELQRRRS